MLYETLFQGQVFLCMLYFGIIGGIVFDLVNLIEKSFKQNKIVCAFLDTLFLFVTAVLFITSQNITNYGEFRFYLLISFCLGIVLEHISIGYLVDKFFLGVYNMFNKLFKKLFKSKKKLRNYDK